MIGNPLSHCRILSEIGRGGMGILCRAEDWRLGLEVAFEVLPRSALSSEDDRARFFREARAAASLNHPHIGVVYEAGEATPEGFDESRPFIAMERIDGESLEARIRKGPLKLDEAVRIACEIASGLDAAHEKGIVHRDIKASNVMLTRKGEAKALGFGLALTSASTRLTRQEATVGTVAYMSPEQERGEKVDRRTDLWSLGVVLYEMIAGRLPFSADYEQANHLCSGRRVHLSVWRLPIFGRNLRRNSYDLVLRTEATGDEYVLEPDVSSGRGGSSPDGRFILFTTGDRGFVLRFSDPDRRTEVDASLWRWGPNGDCLYGRIDGLLVRSGNSSDNGFEAGPPEPMIEVGSCGGCDIRVLADRILTIDPSDATIDRDHTKITWYQDFAAAKKSSGLRGSRPCTVPV